jgi:hypothetical protein
MSSLDGLAVSESALICTSGSHAIQILQPGLWPNNSFKPTPHRGVNSVLCATLHAVATPLRGGLTQALAGYERIWRLGNKSCSER